MYMIDKAFLFYSGNAVLQSLNVTSGSTMFATPRATWTPKDLLNH